MFKAIRGNSHNRYPLIETIEHTVYHKYVTYVWSDEGIVEELYSSGDRIGVAHFLSRSAYGYFAFASNRMGGKTIPYIVREDSDDYTRDGIISRHRVNNHGQTFYIDVALNPTYAANH